VSLPPSIQENDRVILFDGVCTLCNFWSRFIIKYDKNHCFKLCSVQSVEGQKILAHFNFPIDRFETMLYVEGNQCYQKSDAFFNVCYVLGLPWSLPCVFRILPKGLRNWLYDRIALNRYTLFGKNDICRLPAADHENRYVSEK
jgi:predicted DCC family thiol-disulfide oxidoreductase YuxK